VLYCSLVVFPGLVVKDYVVLRRLPRLVAGVGGLTYEQLFDVLVKRHLDDCKLLANCILSNTNHPLYLALSPSISTRNTRQQYRLLPARTGHYRNSVIRILPLLKRLFQSTSLSQASLLALAGSWTTAPTVSRTFEALEDREKTQAYEVLHIL